MTEHMLTLQKIVPLTHDTYELTTDRPSGYNFRPGQANHWGLERDGFRDAGKPFTITSLPDQDWLEFVIKSYPTDQYPDHDGFTELIPDMRPGDRIKVDDPGGDIHDQGPGVFIAGGAGITPFIPILKQRVRSGALDECALIFSNKAERDIILRDLWEGMTGLRTVFTVTEEEGASVPKRDVDAALLKEVIEGQPERYYVCGPPPMMQSVIADLRGMGTPDDAIIVEKKWLD